MSANKTNTNKEGKTALGNLMMNSSSNKMPALVPPVLREVGKLAAGVASVSTMSRMSGSSATGNPRNKCALQPGHSLMDWIRLGASGKDLTGVGPRAGHVPVTKQELAKHNKKDDAWLSIRGKVYNVTAYFPFHPGGEEELMRGAGLDATRLFNEVHPWVNYDQILQKCLVGKLVAIDPNINKEALFFGDNNKNSPISSKLPSTSSSNTRLVSPTTPKQNSTSTPSNGDDSDSKSESLEPASLPRFDWIQKFEYITIIFYTKAFSNPLVEISPPTDGKSLNISIVYEDTVFRNELIFHEEIIWPCETKVTCETGKVEMVFRKVAGKIWENYGVLRQQSQVGGSVSAGVAKYRYVLRSKQQVARNIFLLRFEKKDGGKLVVPIGKHVRIFGCVNGAEISRSYTPISESVFNKNNSSPTSTTDTLSFMIKRYPDGNISRYLGDLETNDAVEISKPLGDFELKHVERREAFLLLAAGTGITPMVCLINFLLERRIKKCQFIRLLFFNKSKEDIPFKREMDELQKQDPRFCVSHILSEPEPDWTGLTGHITERMVEDAIQDHLKDTGYTIKDIYCCACGPNGFVALCEQILEQLGIIGEQMHAFQG